MKCKDISTYDILKFIGHQTGKWCTLYPIEIGKGRSVRHAMPANISDNLVKAKMRQLIKNGLVTGCACGCRGDFALTKKGWLYEEP